MITLYNLKQSRSQRIAWLLEALNLPYNVQNFERDPVTKLAPKELDRKSTRLNSSHPSSSRMPSSA